MYGNEVPTSSSVSHCSSASCEGRVPRRPIEPVVWRVVRNGRLAEKRLDDRRRQALRRPDDLVGRVESPLADEDRDLFPRVQHVRGAAQVGFGGEPGAPRADVRIVLRNVPVRGLVVLLVLKVGRDVDVGHAAARERGAAGEVRDVGDVGGTHHSRVVDGDVHEQPVEIDVLLGMGVDEVVVGVPRHREHGLAVELRVVEAVQEVDPAGPGSGETDTEPARVLGPAARHEGGGLLVPDVDETDPRAVLPQRFHDPVDPVARQTEYRVDAPLHQSLDQAVAPGPAHFSPPPRPPRRRNR